MTNEIAGSSGHYRCARPVVAGPIDLWRVGRCPHQLFPRTSARSRLALLKSLPLPPAPLWTLTVELLTEYFADGAKRLRKLWVDGAYADEWLEQWVQGLKQTHTYDSGVI